MHQAARSEAMIRKLLAAAESLFLARSYADVTMDLIAEKAQVTKGALYHHFASKEDLYLAMMAADLEAKRDLFVAAASSASGCRERLRRLTAAYFALPREKRDLIQLVRRDTNVFRDPVRARLVRLYQAALPQPVERIMAEGMRDRELRAADSRLLAWQFIALVELTLNRYAAKVLPDDGARLDYVLDLFFRGADGQRKKEEA
ncbi:MAG: TetR/AcrR family transcriptional regulator [Planctomycetes bacterium]|nr:TetR/AcrR family transcriptional regulator [Planctomycetota bacterium]